MSSAEKLIPYIMQGGILETVPYKKDMLYDDGKVIQTISTYYPSPGKAHYLTLALKPDHKNPGEFIVQYTEPFGKGWDANAKKYLAQLEFELDENPKHQYLTARNVKDIRIGQPDKWEIEEFRISLLDGGQLTVWTNWERPVDGGDPDKYIAGYVWPPC